MSVRSRIIGMILTLLLLLSLFFVNRVEKVIRPAYLMSIEESVVDMATFLSSQIETSSANGSIDLESFKKVLDRTLSKPLDAKIYDLEKTKVGLRVYVTDAQGTLIFDSAHQDHPGRDYSGWADVRKTLSGSYGARATWEGQDEERHLVLYAGSPILIDGATSGVVTVGKSTAYGYLNFIQARRHSFYGFLVILLFVAILGISITLWITRPTKRLMEYARKIGQGEPSVLPELGRTEIGQLGLAFEKMRDTLEGKNYVESYVQALTHEIKSPLSAIRGAAELLEEDLEKEPRHLFVENIQRESRRIQLLVDRLLELSSIESRKDLNQRESVSMSKLVTDIVKRLHSQLEVKNISVSVPEPFDLQVVGEPFLLNLAVSNLLQNAIDFSEEGSHIQIGVEGQTLLIQDEGPGIPEFALPRVFERFYSWSPQSTVKKSSGLGLSIVKKIAQLHRGSIELENQAPHGLLVRLTIPGFE